MTRLLPALPLLLLASPAAAHLPPGSYGSFAAGATHPLLRRGPRARHGRGRA